MKTGNKCLARISGILELHGDAPQQMKICPENFRWYAAFHNEGHHPHVRMMACSIKPTEPYLTDRVIANIKRTLAHEIFRQDLMQIYQKQIDLRDDLRQESRDRITKIVAAINHGSFDNPQMQMMLVQAALRLHLPQEKKQALGQHSSGQEYDYNEELTM